MGRLRTLLIYLSTTLIFSFLTLSSADDSAAMAKLLASFGTAPSGWSATTDCCKWKNVNCDGSNRVTSISLASQSLTGILPSDLGTLTQLTTLSLQGNSLSGPLPSLANLTSLQKLYLDNNNFTSIPSGFFQGLISLQILSLSQNLDLAPWTISTELTQATSLVTFYASNANIIGSLPDIFGSFPSLQDLRLSYNNLNGTLPKSFGGSGIQNLWLNNQQNGLSGTIDVLSSMTQLSQVWLHKNQFTGPIPDLSNCTSLFDLQLRDNQFTGLIPASLMSIPSLRNVSLDNNVLQGPYPQFPSSVTNHTLGSINSFCKNTPGPCDPLVTTLLEIASAFGYPIKLANSWTGNNACTGWTFINCDSQGSIITINFAKQQFVGTISPVFAKLTSLRNLYLNDNNLTGSIPDALTNMTSLQVLDVSNNNLTGLIPKFGDSVKLTTTGNPLIGKNTPSSGSGGSSPSGSNGTSPSGNPAGMGSSGTSVSHGMIAGIVIAVMIFVVVVLFVSIKCYVSRRHRKFGRVENPQNGKEVVKSIGITGGVSNSNGYGGVPSELQSQSSATGRVTTKVDVYAFGVVLMELITGRRALDDTMPDERSHLVTWFRRILINKENIPKAIDQNLSPDEETMESIYKVAELAGHCTAREPYQRPDMGHAVNILSPLVEQWKPTSHEEEDTYGIDLDMSLPQALQRWQANEGTSTMFNDISYSQTQSSIPSKPSGFADSFDSMDCR
ncbi:receptor-like kinase tmk4 [Quercus suber]|uniref:Receptor-like kinase tmk4 n=1 Tax=Quercus suber TaxID=58331 RepID=A0AAW0ITX8_QUESU